MKNKNNKNIYNGKIINLVILLGSLMAIQGSYFSMNATDTSKLAYPTFKEIEIKPIIEIFTKYGDNPNFILFKKLNRRLGSIRYYLDPKTKKFDIEKIKQEGLSPYEKNNFQQLIVMIEKFGTEISTFLNDKEMMSILNKTTDFTSSDFKKDELLVRMESFHKVMTRLETQSDYMLQMELVNRLINSGMDDVSEFQGFIKILNSEVSKDIFFSSPTDNSDGSGERIQIKTVDRKRFFKEETLTRNFDVSTTTTLSQNGILFIKALLKEYGIEGELQLTDSTTENQITPQDKVLLNELIGKLILDPTKSDVEGDKDPTKSDVEGDEDPTKLDVEGDKDPKKSDIKGDEDLKKLDGKVLNDKVVDSKKEGNKSFMEKNGLGLAVGAGLTIPVVGAAVYGAKSSKAKNAKGSQEVGEDFDK
jgi:hypothetical protein